jgi:hypothetical protein
MSLHIRNIPLLARIILILNLTLIFSGTSIPASAQSVPGGFIANDDSTVVRPQLTPSQIAAFMPSRGAFIFPAPYNTQGVRITNSSDCGGQDCVDMIYSYWRNMSNSAGSNIMYIFVGLDQSRGGQGPTLFSFNKTTNSLTDMGPLFDSSSVYSRQSGEGWYFSYSMPTKIYLSDDTPQLLRYDVLSHTFETIFDVSTAYPNTVLHQTNTSNDDDVDSATLEDATTYAPLGCIAYKVSTKQFFFYPTTGSFDECQIDKSGRYLVIKEKVPSDTCSSCDVDNVIVDLTTGVQTILLDQNGAGGHSDLGYGWYLASDDWSPYANAWRLWDLSQPLDAGAPLGTGNLLQGGYVHQDLNWSAFEPSHISFENANANLPINQQYACGGGDAQTPTAPYDDEIVCFMLDSSTPLQSEQVLVVAPIMTDANANGGNITCPGCSAYAKDPKGNIDPTGQYFFWTSNLGGARLDAFIVKIPSQLLTGIETDPSTPTSPAITITSPTDNDTVSGTIVVTAAVLDPASVVSVNFILDGSGPDTTVSHAPYTITWDTNSTTPGIHTWTAIANYTSGNSITSKPVTFAISDMSSTSKGGGGFSMAGIGLLLLAFLSMPVATPERQRRLPARQRFK